MTGQASACLNADALLDIKQRGVPVAEYDRAGLVAGIVHFGVGGFHRSHQALAVDRWFEQTALLVLDAAALALDADDPHTRDAMHRRHANLE